VTEAPSLEQARRIAVRAQLLDGSARGALETVRQLGFLQIDPISTVAPPQQLVLFSRLGPFEPTELDRLIWEERKLFEWNAFIWPIEDLPLVRARMMKRRRLGTSARDRWIGEFLKENARFRRYVLRELERSGPLPSRQLESDLMAPGEAHRWWGTRQVRLMLEILHARGEIAVAGRSGKQRLWDLGERVFPPTETLPWREAEREIEQKRRRSLGVWKERGRWHIHPDVPDDPVPKRVTVLSPFDRLIHDRDRAEYLWNFHYRLEMYVPKAKREYGYYVLPILSSDRVVGRIEPVFDGKTRELRVNGVWWEDGVRPVSLTSTLKRLARFLGGSLAR